MDSDEFRERYCGEPRTATENPAKPGRTRGRAKAMNKTEVAYAAVLEARRIAGEIAAWWFEDVTFRLGPDCRYTPDFVILLPSGTMEIHEVKGHMEDDARVKMLWCVQKFRMRLLLVTKGNGGFEHKEIAA